MSFQPPKGTDDLLAPESQAWRVALRLWEMWSERYGYPLIMTPIFESTDLFERGVGETTEVVAKQMYTFKDKGGRMVTLRPEGTAGSMRAFLNSGQRGAWKGAYSGPFFRYERPQAGRRRQFWQVGVEYIDVQSPEADAEVIELGYRYLEDVGVPGLELLLNSLGDPECRPPYVDVLKGYLRSIAGDLSEDSVRLIEVNPLRVLDSKVDKPALADAPRIADHLCEACSEHFGHVKDLLERLGIKHTEDHGLVRGLDYYTRTTFEYVATELDAAQNAVGGGGRYDGLAEMIGGPATPGVGFALGMDRIILSSSPGDLATVEAYLVSETGPSDALEIASRLRLEGVAVDFESEGKSIRSQFKAARRAAAPVILVWRGPDQLVDVQAPDGRFEMSLEEIPGWLEDRT